MAVKPKTKKTTKKTTQKSKTPQKTTSKKSTKSTEKNALLKELQSLIKDMNEDGLKFLINQTRVMLYNMKVDELNTEIKNLETKKRTIKKKAQSDKLALEIVEADDNSSFIFVINKARKFFSLEEMKKIVKLCHISKDGNDASQRMYNWFKKNRSDVLVDVGIGSSKNPALQIIYDSIIKKYTIKE